MNVTGSHMPEMEPHLEGRHLNRLVGQPLLLNTIRNPRVVLLPPLPPGLCRVHPHLADSTNTAQADTGLFLLSFRTSRLESAAWATRDQVSKKQNRAGEMAQQAGALIGQVPSLAPTWWLTTIYNPS